MCAGQLESGLKYTEDVTTDMGVAIIQYKGISRKFESGSNVLPSLLTIVILLIFNISHAGIVNEPPPPPPPVVTPTSGLENSINYTAPNLILENVRLQTSSIISNMYHLLFSLEM